MAKEMDMDELGTYAGDIKRFMESVEEELTEYIGVTSQAIVNRLCDYLESYAKGIRHYNSSIISSTEDIENEITEMIQDLLYEKEE